MQESFNYLIIVEKITNDCYSYPMRDDVVENGLHFMKITENTKEKFVTIKNDFHVHYIFNDNKYVYIFIHPEFLTFEHAKIEEMFKNLSENMGLFIVVSIDIVTKIMITEYNNITPQGKSESQQREIFEKNKRNMKKNIILINFKLIPRILIALFIIGVIIFIIVHSSIK